jgi:hypothetical protein
LEIVTTTHARGSRRLIAATTGAMDSNSPTETAWIQIEVEASVGRTGKSPIRSRHC